MIAEPASVILKRGREILKTGTEENHAEKSVNHVKCPLGALAMPVIAEVLTATARWLALDTLTMKNIRPLATTTYLQEKKDSVTIQADEIVLTSTCKKTKKM